MESNKNTQEDKKFIILVIGDTGQGKSSFVNNLLGDERAITGGIEHIGGVTKEITEHSGKMFGKAEDIIVFDTPGFGDQSVNFFDLADSFQEKLANKKVDCIVIVFKGNDHRLNSNTITCLNYFKEFLDTEDPSLSIIILITHCDLINNEKIVSAKVLDFINSELSWKITNVVCFNIKQLDKSLCIFADLIYKIKTPLQMKSEIPAEKIYEMIKNDLSQSKSLNDNSFYGDKKLVKVPEFHKEDGQNLTSEYKRMFKVCFLGDTAVGKTSIIRRLTEPDNIDISQTISTIGIDYKTTTVNIYGELIDISLWDTGGQERFASMNNFHLKNADCVWFVFDINDVSTYEKLCDFYIESAMQNCPKNIIKYLIGNKTDIGKRQVDFVKANRLAEDNGMKYIEVSAKDCQNIEENNVLAIAKVIYENKSKNGDNVRSRRTTIKLSDPVQGGRFNCQKWLKIIFCRHQK